MKTNKLLPKRLGFLVILFAVMVIGFSTTTYADDQKSITVSGIPYSYKDKVALLSLYPSANSQSPTASSLWRTITGTSVTFPLMKEKDSPWSGSGNFVFVITISEDLLALVRGQYLYTGQTVATSSVNQTTTTVQWSQFISTVASTTPGQTAQTSSDFQTAKNNSGGVTITKYTGKATNVVIPATIEGNKVTEIGARAFYENKSITSVTIPDTVTSIEGTAFQWCEGLKSVTIPNNVINIGEQAFTECKSLASITVNTANTAYISDNGVLYNKNKTTLIQYPAGKKETSFTIPNSVTRIAVSAFSQCESITSITIPSSVNSIGFFAFADCKNLSNIIIPNSVTTIEAMVFIRCTSLRSVTIGNGVKKIEMSAFKDCTSLTSVTFLGTIPSAGFSVQTPFTDPPFSGDLRAKFYATDSRNGTPGTYKTTAPVNNDSKWLQTSGDFQLAGNNSGGVTITKYTGKATNVVIPATIEGNKVTEIGERAFYENKSITSVTIPDTVTSIKGTAFQWCEGLKSVTIPDNVTDIGEQAFSECNSLTSITVNTANTAYISDNGVLYNKNKTTLIQYPAGKKETTFTVPASVTRIALSAFSNCESITNITIPSSVNSIGRLAFTDCKNLSNIIIPNSVTTIGALAFYRCTSLRSVTIGNGVKEIEMSAFGNCTNLTSVTFQGTIPSTGFSGRTPIIDPPFDGDLRAKFYATDSRNGTPGTYKTTAPVNENSRWTRQ